MGNVNLKINGLNVTAPAGSTILEAAQAAPRLGVLEGGHFRAESDPKGAGADKG